MLRPWTVFFDTIGRDPVGFEMARVDHERREIGRGARQGFEHAPKHRPRTSGCSHSVLAGPYAVGTSDHRIPTLNAENEPGQHPPGIHSGNTSRLSWLQGIGFVELVFRKPEMRRHQTSQISCLEAHHSL